MVVKKKNKKGAIKNYTTQISIEKTIYEIEQILAKFGATHIYKIYKDSIPMGLAFTLEVNNSHITFKLPMKEDQVLLVFNKQIKKGLIPKKYSGDKEQSRRVGWRIIKDWIDSQLALIEIEFVTPEEIFLPYIFDVKANETFYEKLQKKGFSNLLEDKI